MNVHAPPRPPALRRRAGVGRPRAEPTMRAVDAMRAGRAGSAVGRAGSARRPRGVGNVGRPTAYDVVRGAIPIGGAAAARATGGCRRCCGPAHRWGGAHCGFGDQPDRAAAACSTAAGVAGAAAFGAVGAAGRTVRWAAPGVTGSVGRPMLRATITSGSAKTSVRQCSCGASAVPSGPASASANQGSATGDAGSAATDGTRCGVVDSVRVDVSFGAGGMPSIVC